MSKYIKYKRISETLSPNDLNEKLDSFIKEGWEIIHYGEKTLDKSTNGDEKILVNILIGKLNDASFNRQIL